MHLGAVFMTVGCVAIITGPWNPQGASRRTSLNPGARTGSGHSAERRAVGRHKFDDHPGRQQHVNHGDDWAPVKCIHRRSAC